MNPCLTSTNQRFCTSEKGEFEYCCSSCSGLSGLHSTTSGTGDDSGILYHLKKHRESCETCRKHYEEQQEKIDQEYGAFNCEQCGEKAYKIRRDPKIVGDYCSINCQNKAEQ